MSYQKANVTHSTPRAASSAILASVGSLDPRRVAAMPTGSQALPSRPSGSTQQELSSAACDRRPAAVSWALPDHAVSGAEQDLDHPDPASHLGSRRVDLDPLRRQRRRLQTRLRAAALKYSSRHRRSRAIGIPAFSPLSPIPWLGLTGAKLLPPPGLRPRRPQSSIAQHAERL